MKKQSKIVLNREENGFLIDGSPAFEKVFAKAMNFHFPEGAAAVMDESGAYHIDTEGVALYEQRYLESYGYYCGLATVCDDRGFFHIDVHGNPVHDERYLWSGNYQEGNCVVKTKNGYCHIDARGNSLYEERYEYVGDFKYGIAVVHTSEGAIHIQQDGVPLNRAVHNDADPFHKGFAVVSDSTGYYHVNKIGKPLHGNRFLKAEPFYNGLARCLTHEGQQVLLRENGFYTYVRKSGAELSVDQIKEFVAKGAKVGIFIRHGERAPRPKGEWGNDLLLTDRGVEQSLALGKRLAFCCDCSFHSSPIERCIQTVQGIASGIFGERLSSERIEISEMLGDPGPFNNKENPANFEPDKFSKVADTYLDNGEINGLYPLSEACERLCNYLCGSLTSSLNIFGTHDFFVAGLERFQGLRHPKNGDWIDFLESVCFVDDGSGKVQWYIFKGAKGAKAC